MYLFRHFSKVIKILSYLIGTSMLVLFKFILPGVAFKKNIFYKEKNFLFVDSKCHTKTIPLSCII